MFKSVEFVGFEGQLELKMKAEQLTTVLANKIHRWQEDVEVLDCLLLPRKSDNYLCYTFYDFLWFFLGSKHSVLSSVFSIFLSLPTYFHPASWGTLHSILIAPQNQQHSAANPFTICNFQ